MEQFSEKSETATTDAVQICSNNWVIHSQILMEQMTQLKKAYQHEPKTRHGEGADQNCHPEPITDRQTTGKKIEHLICFKSAQYAEFSLHLNSTRLAQFLTTLLVPTESFNQIQELQRLYHVQKQLMQQAQTTAPASHALLAVVDIKPRPQQLDI